jgi:bifunctional DNase/RNase
LESLIWRWSVPFMVCKRVLVRLETLIAQPVSPLKKTNGEDKLFCPSGSIAMIEMVIASIRASTMNYQRVVILKEKSGERYLPIWIGSAEADAIAVKLQGVNVLRPLHDLLCSIIAALGASINFVLLSDFKNDTFYAKIVFNTGSRKLEVDSRPSDALALALRTGVPIYADEVVLDKGAIMLDKETGKPISSGKELEGDHEKEVSEDELRKMSAFRDFIDKLDLNDLDKHKS